MPKQQTYNGLTFNCDEKTGYYLCTCRVGKKRPRLHRYVWETNNGPIPKGHHVHHKNGNRGNNDISNLELMKQGEHLSHHGQMEKNKLISRKNLLEFAQPEAAKWHKSEECREISRKNWYKSLGKYFEVMVTLMCEQCSEEYKVDSLSAKKNSRFCSNKCKSKWRRQANIDVEARECVVCENKFEAKKYRGAKTCSRECKSKLLVFNRNGIKRF